MDTIFKLEHMTHLYNLSCRRQDVVYGHINRYVALIGVENYFLEYEIKVGAFNNLGDGPNSTVFTVMSAEDSNHSCFLLVLRLI